MIVVPVDGGDLGMRIFQRLCASQSGESRTHDQNVRFRCFVAVLGFAGHLFVLLLGFSQWAVHPPSTGSAAPVMEAAPGPDRNTASAPISSTVANILLGCCANSTSRITSSRP